jgi:hypothetical protein
VLIEPEGAASRGRLIPFGRLPCVSTATRQCLAYRARSAKRGGGDHAVPGSLEIGTEAVDPCDSFLPVAFLPESGSVCNRHRGVVLTTVNARCGPPR